MPARELVLDALSKKPNKIFWITFVNYKLVSMRKKVKKLWPLAIVSSFILIVACFFYFNVWLSPINNFRSPRMVRAVDLKTQVADNPYNSAAKQLQAKEKNLNTVANELRQSGQTRDFLLFILVIMIIALFLLVLLNYYLDFRRKRNDNVKK